MFQFWKTKKAPEDSAAGQDQYQSLAGIPAPPEACNFTTGAIPPQFSADAPQKDSPDVYKTLTGIPAPPPVMGDIPSYNEAGDFVRVDRYVCPGVMFSEGALSGNIFSISGETVLGREPGCAIRFPESTQGVSRRHLRLWAEDGRLYAMDLKSTWGSWLNGMPMKPGLAYLLESGDTVRLGRDELLRML